ncbi:MAG TPA: hypothetical protein VFL80_07730 [Thermoanaerobaculia bacterium]|nr:hypothetical protein [Thermoanaerobaculia bacterium]
MTVDIHTPTDFFEYTAGLLPRADPKRIDVAVLDMNHSWPNIGHDSIVHAIQEAAEHHRPRLVAAGLKVRAISFDVRRKLQMPATPNGQFALYVGTGGPGHLDPRLNDGVAPWSQETRDDPAWEAPLFRLFDAVLGNPRAAMVGVCHSFGLLCRWSGAARAALRERKSAGLQTNVLSPQGIEHPWFSRFAAELPDQTHFQVIDNRLFDLVLEDAAALTPLGFEDESSDVMTMAEFARDAESGMPRVLGVNHHPEIIDREHLLQVLNEKRERGEVSDAWYEERWRTLEKEMRGERETQSRLTSYDTLLAPIRFHIGRLLDERC